MFLDMIYNVTMFTGLMQEYVMYLLLYYDL